MKPGYEIETMIDVGDWIIQVHNWHGTNVVGLYSFKGRIYNPYPQGNSLVAIFKIKWK